MTRLHKHPRGRRMSTDEVMRLRCLACGAIWLRRGEMHDVNPGKHCLRCDGELVTDD